MKSIKRTFAATIVAGICMLAGCAAAGQPASRVHPIFASDAPNLPPGHPAIDPSALPAGDSSNPPPGCPASNSAGQTTPASTQPCEIGTLNIHAVQCTPKGPAIGADPVNIEFLVKGQLLDHMDTHLNAAGTLQITGLPVRFGIQPVVKITHAGVVFTTAGDLMDPDHSTLKLDVPIFESTDQTPNWSVTMRHVIIHPSAAGIDVTEMLSIQSTGDRAWIGKADAHGVRTTFCLTLPADARDLKVGGALDGAAVFVADGKLFSKQPLIPGEDRYELQYRIPAVDNKAVLSVTAPASVGHLLVFVPEDGTTVDAPALQAMGAQQLDEKGPKTRCYFARSLSEGQTIALTVGGLKSAASVLPVSSVQTPKLKPLADNSIASKAIAVGGAIAILLVGTTITLLKHPKSAQVQNKR
ncbi:MAG: hypothetical protein ABSH08_09110 [Tepidisphaeraceae bacterium]|jgi:hypothetical protein